MPRLEDAEETLLETGRSARESVKGLWEGFTDFALRDNVLEVAVGLILAAAFTTLVSSFVSSILLPPISLLPFLNRNLEEKFAVLRRGRHYPYNTLAQGVDDGAVVMAYGAFLDQVVNFVGVGLALYAVASAYGWASSDPIVKRQVKCRYCKKWISEKAKRCVNCTSWQDGREG